MILPGVLPYTEKKQIMTELDMLHDYRLNASIAATSYLALSTRAYDENIRQKFLDLAVQARKAEEEIRKLIHEYGGKT